MSIKPTTGIRKIYKFARQTENISNLKLRIGIAGRKKIVKTIRDTFGADPISSVVEIPDMSFAGAFDLLIIALKDVAELTEKAHIIEKSAAPVIIVFEQSKAVTDKTLDKLEGLIDLNSLIFLKESDFQKRLHNAVVRELDDKKLAIARVLPLFRNRIAADIISDSSKQNALIGAAVFLPGADMPILTLNQMKMVLELAAVHNESLSVERAKELLVTFGSGYIFRAVARQLLGFVPGPGFIVKGIVAYTGTRALGQLAHEYFTRGAFPLEIGNKSKS